MWPAHHVRNSGLCVALMHQPYGDVYGQWRAMESLNREGRAKAIGVSNFYPDRLLDLVLNNEIAPAVNQIEVHPFFQRAAEQELMREHGIQIQSWGGFAEGKNNLFTNPLLSEIGRQHGKSVAQVVLRWLTQRGVVAIPKSVRPERMAENIDVFDFELADEQMASIATWTRRFPVLRPPRSGAGQLAREAPRGLKPALPVRAGTTSRTS